MISAASFALVLYASARFFRALGPAAAFGLMLALGLVGALIPGGGVIAGLLAAGAAWSVGHLPRALTGPGA
jgi:hypothetical protein